MRTSRLWRRFLAVVTLAAVTIVDGRAQALATNSEDARARELVLRIRRSMREIDALLLKGSQPHDAESKLAANQKRFEELLRESESKSASVVQGMDELIKHIKSGCGA